MKVYRNHFKYIALFFLICSLTSCGSRAKYNMYKEQAKFDEANYELKQIWNQGQTIHLNIQSQDMNNILNGQIGIQNGSSDLAQSIHKLAATSDSWAKDPNAYAKPYTYNSKLHNFQLYYNDPNYSKLGFSPFRNNAAVYRDYYKSRCNKWSTIWGLLN